MLLATQLERIMKLDTGGLHFSHQASRYEIPLNARAGIADSGVAHLHSIRSLLMQYPQLKAVVLVPAYADGKRLDSLRARLFEESPALEDPRRAEIRTDTDLKKSLIVTLR